MLPQAAWLDHSSMIACLVLLFAGQRALEDLGTGRKAQRIFDRRERELLKEDKGLAL